MSWPPIVNTIAIVTVHAIAFFGIFDSGSEESSASVVSGSEQSVEAASNELDQPAGPDTSSDAAPVNPYEIATDRSLGNPAAAVTIIEYASVTCGHCADFHKSTFKKIKEKYVDTGLVRFVFREFPTPPADRAYAGFLLARCVPQEKYFGVVDVLFKRQNNWAFARDAYPELERIAKATGLSVEEFQTCLQDQEQIDRITNVAENGRDKYGITATPSFVINGEKHSVMNWSDFQKLLDGLLAVN